MAQRKVNRNLLSVTVRVKKDLEKEVVELSQKLNVEPHLIRNMALALGLKLIKRSLEEAEIGIGRLLEESQKEPLHR